MPDRGEGENARDAYALKVHQCCQDGRRATIRMRRVAAPWTKVYSEARLHFGRRKERRSMVHVRGTNLAQEPGATGMSDERNLGDREIEWTSVEASPGGAVQNA